MFKEGDMYLLRLSGKVGLNIHSPERLKSIVPKKTQNARK
jgi:hypothetical protein